MNAGSTKIIFIVMGVSGCGKTTVGAALAQRLNLPFYDGDDFHPAANIEKMAGGIPLTDDDRLPWLSRLHALIASHRARGEGAVIACSALKRRYRDHLRAGLDGVQFVHLQGSFDLIWERMRARHDHFMRADMLQSQFDALEAPAPDEALMFRVDAPTDTIVEQLARWANDTDH